MNGYFNLTLILGNNTGANLCEEEALIMFKLIEKAMAAVQKYTVVDMGFFKFLMITFGILLGVYFTEPILNIIWLVWIIFIVSAVWMILKIFTYMK